MDTLTFISKSVYGKVLVYPVSVKAHMFAHLIKKKTFDQQDLYDILSLGFFIELDGREFNLDSTYENLGLYQY